MPVPKLMLIPHGPWPVAKNTPPSAPGLVRIPPPRSSSPSSPDPSSSLAACLTNSIDSVGTFEPSATFGSGSTAEFNPAK
ncbi:hypothetical protein N0V85_008582 [Neurospora sp. IMI 360204]|nr:hypothetical protein N0V85_008582 [Neurospora sp. IMI 360204]